MIIFLQTKKKSSSGFNFKIKVATRSHPVSHCGTKTNVMLVIRNRSTDKITLDTSVCACAQIFIYSLITAPMSCLLKVQRSSHVNYIYTCGTFPLNVKHTTTVRDEWPANIQTHRQLTDGCPWRHPCKQQEVKKTLDDDEGKTLTSHEEGAVQKSPAASCWTEELRRLWDVVTAVDWTLDGQFWCQTKPASWKRDD